MKTFYDIIYGPSGCLAKSRISEAQTTYVNMIKAGVNKRYVSLMNQRKWWFLRTPRDLYVPAKYEAGTCTVTNGSREVTFGGIAAVSDNFKGRFFSLTGTSEVYRIVATDETNNKIILSAQYIGTTVADTQYWIWQGEFGLWPDCEEIDDIWHDKYHRCIDPIGPRELTKLIAHSPKCSGYARKYTRSGRVAYGGVPLGVFLLGHDFLAGAKENSENLVVYPTIPQAEYILHVVYTRIIREMTANADQPVLPETYNYMLVDGGLAEFFGDINNTVKRDKFEAAYQRQEEALRRKHDDVFDLPILRPPDYFRGACIDDVDNYAWDERWDRIW